jgi:hypothetical protein
MNREIDKVMNQELDKVIKELTIRDEEENITEDDMPDFIKKDFLIGNILALIDQTGEPLINNYLKLFQLLNVLGNGLFECLNEHNEKSVKKVPEILIKFIKELNVVFSEKSEELKEVFKEL